MGQVIQILNPEFNAVEDRRHRLWLSVGDSISVERFVLTLERVRGEQFYSAVMVAYAVDHDQVERLDVPGIFNFMAFDVPFVMAPKAVEFDAVGRPDRVLLEFCGVEGVSEAVRYGH